MGVELGRISGPLLATNLVRHGIDLSFETDLLFLYVSDNDPANFKVGIKTDTPGRLLDVANKLTSVNFIVDNTLTVPNFDIHTNEIQNLTGPIYISPTGQTLDGILDGGLSGTLSFVGEEDGGGSGTLVFNPIINGGNSSPYGTAPEIHAPALTTDNLKITDQLIKNLITGSNIELSPSGTGIVRFNSYEVNINGSLHATGDVTWDGSITFGNDNTDNVNLSSDITSDIIPDVTNTYDLGSTLKRWRDLYSDEIIATSLLTDTLTINNINLLLTPGKTIYVSKNGSDTNYGNHAHSTFATLKQALTSAVSGDTIVIFPGVYEEQFPLTIPSGVGIRGSGIRATTIKPTLATNSKDAFLISGDTMLEFFTISDFYFDSVNNTGYAFRFAPGFKTTGRSPYFHNITVKTQGSVTSPTDLRGFASGDAGAGGYFDGSVADPTSNVIPTALFFSVTFITPNANALTLMNGARCEWLNSFTYFAKRGTYLVNGTAGRYNQGTVFGAELRAINSANVYGTYGAVADGADTLAYLIGHNFGYVGTDGDYTNDPTLAIQANEVRQLNNGVVYYETTDHLGDIRVGDIFYVSQETGRIAFDAQSITIDAGGNITIEGPDSIALINELGYQSGNIRVSGNTIASLIGPVNFLANAGANTTYINTNVEITGSLDISSDLTADSNVYFGSTPLDTITVNSYLTQDINPIAPNLLYLGSTSFRWSRLNSNALDINGVTQITSNEISTLSGNTELKLQADGTGRIRAATNSVQIDNNLDITNNLTVNGTTNLKNTVIGSGALASSLSFSSSNYLSLSAAQTIGTQAYTFECFFYTASNGLQTLLGASAAVGMSIWLLGDGINPVTIIQIDRSGVDNAQYTVSPITTNTWHHIAVTRDSLNNASVFLDGVKATGATTNTANYTGASGLIGAVWSSVYFFTGYLTQIKLTVGSNYYSPTASSISVPTTALTTSANTKLLLTVANGAAYLTDTSGTQTVSNIGGVAYSSTGPSTSNITHVGNYYQTGNTYITGLFANNNIEITGNSYFQVPNVRLYDNVISNQLLDQDLIFTANGTGAVRVEKLNFVDNIISNAWLGATTESQKNVILSPNGSGNTVINSTKALKLPVGSNTNRTMLAPAGIRYNNTYNRYEGYQPNGLVSFTNMYSYDTTSASYITSLSKTTLGITTVSINVGEYTIQVSSTAGLSVGFKVVSGPSVTPGTRITSIDGNIITIDLPTTNSIAGVIVFGPVILNFALISGLQVGQLVSGTNIQAGTTIVSWNSTSITMSLPISGNVLIGSSITFGPINATYITPELTPGASDNTLRFGINGVVKATLSSTAFVTNTWNVGNINISSNNIGQLTSADLYITPDSGITNINDISIQDNEVTNNLDSEFLIQSTGQGYVKFAGRGAVVFPIGNDSERRLVPVIGETRYNTDQNYLEVYNGEGWYPAIGTSGAASEEEIVEITNLWSLVLG